MIRIGIRCFLTVWLVLFGAQPDLLWAQAKTEEAAGPDFKEVYDLVRAHLAGMSEAQLNQAAVQALVSGFGSRVSLVTNGAAAKAQAGAPLVSKSSVFDGDIGYIRIEQVGDGLASAVREACNKLAATNKLAGVILDLRYTAGGDYASAVATAELFVKKAQALLNWG